MEEAIELLGIEVSDDVQHLIDCGDNKAYAEEVVRVIERQWRAIALRLHPDKQSSSWSCSERQRLRDVYDYYNDARRPLARRTRSAFIHSPMRPCVVPSAQGHLGGSGTPGHPWAQVVL